MADILIRQSDIIEAFVQELIDNEIIYRHHLPTSEEIEQYRAGVQQVVDRIPAIEQIPKDIVEQAGNGNVIMSENTYDELIEGSTRRKKGSWIYYGKPIPATSDHYGADCSECGAYSEYLDNFCGNCGADMRGEEQ